ncbi:MAG TPA: SDR family oxidoreductase [Candidatus Binatia bacterium]|nr:SDR family oxidoreductase [Candidatus Binatia bacterium]
MALRDQRILVTGAGSGLGRALALTFARAGWRVAASDRDEAAARQTLAEVQALGATGLALALDVTSEESFAGAVRTVEQAWGGLDVLVNNAGVGTSGTVADSPLEQWRWVLDINLLGCVRGARAVIPLMRRQQAGHIVNVASFAGIANPPGMASYNVAKAGVVSLSETLRFELFPHGVGVSVVCPEFFKTNLLATSKALAPRGTDVSGAAAEKITQRLMEKATVTADDVARDIFEAVRDGTFLVIPHAEARKRHWLKRFAPEVYFRKAQKATEKFLAKASGGSNPSASA